MVSFDEKKPPSGIFNRIPRKQRWKTYNIWIPFFSLSFCDLWSPEDLTSLWLIILCSDNTLGTGEKEGLIDLPLEQSFCMTFYILMMDVWLAAFLVFQHCTSFGFPTLPAFSSCLMKIPVCRHVCVQAAAFPQVFPGCPAVPGGSAWGEAMIQLVKGDGSSCPAPNSFSFFCLLPGSSKSRPLFSADLPSKKRTKVPLQLEGGDANRFLVPDGARWLQSLTASDRQLVSFLIKGKQWLF